MEEFIFGLELIESKNNELGTILNENLISLFLKTIKMDLRWLKIKKLPQNRGVFRNYNL
jgi:hypothetical protein